MFTKNKPRILIIDEDEIWRKGCEIMLSEIEDFLVVGSYSSLGSSKRGMRLRYPHLILLGLNSPDIDNTKIVSEIKKLYPHIEIIVLTMHNHAEVIFESFRMGVAGYLSKNLGIEKLADAIRDVLKGGAVMSAIAARIVISFFQKNKDSPLTNRETQIMQRMAEGRTKAQIASDLFINQNTVRSHVKNIYIKLNVNSKSEAIKRVKEMRFI